MDHASSELPNLVRRYRKEKGYTLQELAEKVEMDKSSLSKIETGKVKNVRDENKKRISRALEVPVEICFCLNQ